MKSPASNKGTQNAASHKPSNSSQPGPNASLPAKAKAYGYYCQGESKKHTPHGDKGTPFSQCVTAMAKVAHSQASAKTACRTLSHKKAKGAKRSDFSTCVNGAAKLKQDLKAAS